MASGKIEEVDAWVEGTITPAQGVTLNTTYSYFRYNPKAKIGTLQLYVTANTRTDYNIVTIDGAQALNGRQFWTIWADNSNGGTGYHRAILANNNVVVSGATGCIGFMNMAFELN